MTNTPVFSILLVNYQVPYLLEQCLLSLRAAAQNLVVEIFVVDNCSADGSVEYLRPRFPEVQFIENQQNLGFAKANNQALSLCSGQYILFLNPDTLLGEPTLEQVKQFFEQTPQAGAVGLKMLDALGTFLPESKRSFPTLWNSFSRLFGLSRLFPRSAFFSRYQLLYLSPQEIHAVEVLSGAFLCVRASILQEIGGFDEAFFMYGEDIDLSYRIHLSSYQNYYLPLPMLHYKGESTNHKQAQYIQAFYQAMLIFYQKYYPLSSRWVDPLVRLALALKKLQARCWGRKDRLHQNLNTPFRQALLLGKPDSESQLLEQYAKHPTLAGLPYQSCLQEQTLTVEQFLRYLQQEGFSELVVVCPDYSFHQVLAFLDAVPEAKLRFHLYHRQSKHLLSPSIK